MRAIVHAVQDTPLILKGGTALLFTRGLDRHSEDIDFDSPTKVDLNSRLRNAMLDVGANIRTLRLKKDTDTVQRYMIDFVHEASGYSPNPFLKIETSFRDDHVTGNRFVDIVDGIRTYPLDIIFRQKLDAVANRTVARDIFDLHFMIREHAHSISDENLIRALGFTENYVELEGRFRQSFKKDAVLESATDAETEILGLRLSLEEISAFRTNMNKSTGSKGDVENFGPNPPAG